MPLPLNYKRKLKSDEELRNFAPAQNVPRDVWIQLIKNNPDLTVIDIQRLCAINRSFRKLCEDKTNSIWDTLLRQELPLELANRMIKKNPNVPGMWRMYRLMAQRIVSKTQKLKDEDYYYYALAKDEKNFVMFRVGEIMGDSTNNGPIFWHRTTHIIIIADDQVTTENLTDFVKTMLTERNIPVNEREMWKGAFEVAMLLNNNSLNDDLIDPKDDEIFAAELTTGKITLNRMALAFFFIYFMMKGYMPFDTTASVALTRCSVCSETVNLKLCGACKQVAYCSTTCQQADWNAHKECCK